MEDVRLYRTLATLVRDVPLPGTLEDLRWRGVPGDAFAAWCDDVRASESLRSRRTMRPGGSRASV
jgi:hypothetical protein